MKETANKLFKEGKFYRASKIYHNINYRFNYGDVFGSNVEENEKKLKESNQDLLSRLIDIRNTSHLNFANCKLKINKFFTAFETAEKVIKNFDGNSQKGLYIYGKSAIILKKYQNALEAFETLVKLSPNTKDFNDGLEEVKSLIQKENFEKKNLYKKMIFK